MRPWKCWIGREYRKSSATSYPHGVLYSSKLKVMVRNQTRNAVLGQSVEVADTSAKGRVGLLRHERLDPGGGLWSTPCESVHTLFMKFPIDLSAEDADALPRSLPGWPVFPEVPAALTEARDRGWRLAILSNSDPDLIDASIGSIGVPFDAAIVASQIGSYKPAHGHWLAFQRQIGRLPDVHVAASLFHDIAPAKGLGLLTVWINRLGETADPEPTRELADLSRLAKTLEELA